MINFLPLALLATMTVVPLDTDFKIQHNNDYHSVETICKVTKAGDIYTYFYSIKNNGKSPVKVKWEMLSKVLNLGQDTEMMWHVEPGDNLNFIVEHPDPPVQYNDRVQTHTLSNKNNFEKTKQNLPKGVKVDIPNAKFYRTDTNHVIGILPKSFTTPAFFPKR